MTKDEEILAAIINERGYLVIQSYVQHAAGTRLTRPQYVDLENRRRDVDTEAKFYVIQATDREDFMQQREVIWKISCLIPLEPIAPHFYRIGTD